MITDAKKKQSILFKIKKFLRGKEKEPEILKEWTIPDVTIKTNIGEQLVDLKCQLKKYFIHRSNISLVERFILGIKPYFYRVNIDPSRPIRENRDKDYLDCPSDEGNDAMYSMSICLEEVTRKKQPDLSEESLNHSVLNSFDYAKHNNVIYKKKKHSGRKEKWTNKTLFKKYDYNDNEFGLYTAIYPFYGSDISGCTNLLSVSIFNHDEQGYGFDISILGFHFYAHSRSFKTWFNHKVLKIRCIRWENGVPWEVFKKQKAHWTKVHPVWNFLTTSWNFELGISRAKGIFYRSEFDGCRVNRGPWWRRNWNFNLLRTSFYNII